MKGKVYNACGAAVSAQECINKKQKYSPKEEVDFVEYVTFISCYCIPKIIRWNCAMSSALI